MRAVMVITICLLLASCQSQTKPYDMAIVPEFRPGMPVGYLAREELPDSLAILPAPPAEGSAAMQADIDVANEWLKEQASPRFAQAARDAVLEFPEAAHPFACVMGVSITSDWLVLEAVA